MKAFLVGGAIRDLLLCRDVKDRDYVVIGSSMSEMIVAGFEPVGMSFPVFLHPITGEEYALARREKKVGEGYTGFEFDTSKDVLLIEDLERRDFTVNSMALDSDGTVIDPFNGQQDLQNRILRHTSDAFGEDPLRVIRLARFYARYSSLGFTVAPETMELCKNMVQSGMLNELPYERFWREIQKMFEDESPQKFFELLRDLGAFEHVSFFKSMFELFDTSNDHTFGQILRYISLIEQDFDFTDDKVMMFAALVLPPSSRGMFPWSMAEQISIGYRKALILCEPLDFQSVHKLFSGCRGFGNMELMMFVLAALKIEERTIGLDLNSNRLEKMLEVGRTVTSDKFRHLIGPAIGVAMAEERMRLWEGLNLEKG